MNTLQPTLDQSGANISHAKTTFTLGAGMKLEYFAELVRMHIDNETAGRLRRDGGLESYEESDPVVREHGDSWRRTRFGRHGWVRVGEGGVGRGRIKG